MGKSGQIPTVDLTEVLRENKELLEIMGIFAALALYLNSLRAPETADFRSLGVLSALLISIGVSFLLVYQIYLEFSGPWRIPYEIMSIRNLPILGFFICIYLIDWSIFAIIYNLSGTLLYFVTFVAFILTLGLGLQAFRHVYNRIQRDGVAITVIAASCLIVAILGLFIIGLITINYGLPANAGLDFSPEPTLVRNVLSTVISVTFAVVILAALTFSFSVAAITIDLLDKGYKILRAQWESL